jgi:RimJ/RimL family protein N-acetyltransferase
MLSPATISHPIPTASLLLEPVRRAFARDLFHHMNDWEVMRWLASPPWPYALGDMHDWIARSTAARAAGRDADYAIMLADRPIGVIGVVGLTLGPVLGYWLGRPFWGRGYMSEAARALIEHVFAEGSSFIASGVLTGNAPSLRIQEKLGFRVVNERHVHARPHGRPMPHLDTVLGRARWSQLRRAA